MHGAHGIPNAVATLKGTSLVPVCELEGPGPGTRLVSLPSALGGGFNTRVLSGAP